jgi:hypothetical protein
MFDVTRPQLGNAGFLHVEGIGFCIRARTKHVEHTILVLVAIVGQKHILA